MSGVAANPRELLVAQAYNLGYDDGLRRAADLVDDAADVLAQPPLYDLADSLRTLANREWIHEPE